MDKFKRRRTLPMLSSIAFILAIIIGLAVIEPTFAMSLTSIFVIIFEVIKHGQPDTIDKLISKWDGLVNPIHYAILTLFIGSLVYLLGWFLRYNDIECKVIPKHP